MAGDTWFRGEGVGVPAVGNGQVIHDLGDGMYLTDNQDVARMYASERSPDLAGQRVYSVTVNLGGKKVLDLTRDARWADFLKPFKPGMPSVEDTFRGPFNENYGKTFQNFCKKYNINPADYDVIIGKEYVRGGKQLVIVAKGGKPAPLQFQVRKTFRVVMQPGATPTRMPKGALGFKGKIGPGLRSAGAAAGMAAIGALFDFLDNKLRERFARDEIRKLEPKISAAIAGKTREVARILADGEKPYANITISSTTITNNLGMFTKAGEPTVSYPMIELVDVAISTRNLTSEKDTHTFGIIAPTDSTTWTYSIPMELSQQEVELYRAYLLELRWYDEQAKRPVDPAYLLQLSRERNELLQELDRAFAVTP